MNFGWTSRNQTTSQHERTVFWKPENRSQHNLSEDHYRFNIQKQKGDKSN